MSSIIQNTINQLQSRLNQLQPTIDAAGQRGAIPETPGACSGFCSYERTHGFRTSNPDCDACNQVSTVLTEYRDLQSQLTILGTQLRDKIEEEATKLSDLAPTINQTASSPNIISLGIPALIIGGGILWLLTRR